MLEVSSMKRLLFVVVMATACHLQDVLGLLPYSGKDSPKVEYGGRIGDDTWYSVTNGLSRPVKVFLECAEEMRFEVPAHSQKRFLYNNLDKTRTDGGRCVVGYWE